jgi:hypothetical protein
MSSTGLAMLYRCGCVAAVVLLLASGGAAAQPATAAKSRTPKQVYDAACSHCHGVDGRGGLQERLSLPVPPRDFTDCQFGPREPDSDWTAIIQGGGPTRAFHRFMPSFDDALTAGEVGLALSHVRTFCADRTWPRGDLNLPKALVTEKAFPEDELIMSSAFATEGDGSVKNKIVYEKRFGARSQIELVIPVTALSHGGGWTGGIGDLAVALKRVIAHSHERGAIMSVTGELVVPTGATDKDLGKGHAVFEPFLTFGKALPSEGFFQFQGGAGLPMGDVAPRESFYRFVFGKSFTTGRWGRSWSPMIEVLGSKTHAAGEKVQWDIVPEMQVSLSTRKHILMNAGVRIPMTDSKPRKTQLLVYLLWDWFDGGFFEGW